MTENSFARVVRVERTGSTSTDLSEAVAADPSAWPHLSVLVTDSQEAGRGRAGRTWETPPGKALTASVLLRPRVPAEALGWVPLLGGLAVQRATAELLTGEPSPIPPRTALKWPNDVLVLDAGQEEIPGWSTDRKVAGLLAEVVPGDEPAVVLGIGVNVAQTRDELPVPWATSLALEGAAVAPDEVLGAVGRHLAPVLEAWEAAGGDALAAGIAVELVALTTTIGRKVTVDLPGGGEVRGMAIGLGADGHLRVSTGDGEEVAVHAGDVGHLRPSE